MRDRNNASGGMHVIVCVFAFLVMATTSMAQSDHAHRQTTDRELAQTILMDERMEAVVRMGHELLKSGMNAGAATIGLTMYPPYPRGLFKNRAMGPYSYQNGGDWTWFGARMVRQLARNGCVEESYRELVPMLERVLKHRGFFEWWTPSNQPKGSGKFRGSAGVLIEAIHELREWANSQSEK